MRKYNQAAAAILASVLVYAGARAATFNSDISGLNPSEGDTGPAFSGNAVLRADGTTSVDPTTGTSSGHWNQTQVFGSAPNTPVGPIGGFTDSSNAPTTVSIVLTNWAGADDCPGCAYGTTNALLEDYLVEADPNPATLSIRGLALNTTTNLFLYTTNNGSTVGGNYSVNGGTAVTATGDDGGTPFSVYKSGVNYLEFDNVSTGATGQIDITVTGETASLGIINGFQLSSVPEPASISLLGLSACSLLARRSRTGRAN